MANNCTACGNKMKEDESIYYCEYCGCNISKKPEEEKQNASSDGENQNFKDMIL